MKKKSLNLGLICICLGIMGCNGIEQTSLSIDQSQLSSDTEITFINTTTIANNNIIDNITTITVNTEIQLPSRGLGSEKIHDCHTNPKFNACIFKRKYPRHKSDPPVENLFGVNILDTFTNDALENASYKISVLWDYTPLEKAALREGKWTKSNLNDVNKTGYQASVYHWLMYQKDWMELNTGVFYASDKGINVELMDTNTFIHKYKPLYSVSGWTAGIWLSNTNTVTLNLNESDDHFQNQVFGTVLHEVGHANLTHSNKNVEHYYSSYTQGACELGLGRGVCCNTYRGCISAINEGQAEFHAYLVDPHNTRDMSELYGCKYEDTARQIFDNCEDYGPKGTVHVVGYKVYGSIWYKLYNHPNVNKKDIATLFSNHLPLISSNDNFETLGAKIIQLAHQMASNFVGNNKDNYPDIIRSEFNKMELYPLRSPPIGTDTEPPSEECNLEINVDCVD